MSHPVYDKSRFPKLIAKGLCRAAIIRFQRIAALGVPMRVIGDSIRSPWRLK